MFNKVQIILDKGKTKAKMFVFWDFNDVIYIVFAGAIGFFIGGKISPIYQLVLCFTLAGILAFLRFQLQNMFSVYEYIKMAYLYYFVSPKKYIYYPKQLKEEVEVESEEKIKETKIFHKKTKRKRKGKY